MAVRKERAPQYRTINIIAAGPEVSVIEHWRSLGIHDYEEAEWKIIPRGTRFTVRFNKVEGTPFKDDVFTGDDTVVSGPILVNVEPDELKQYRYTVEVSGYTPLDPGIIIWRK